MNAKKILELLNKNDYKEIERLARQEITEKECKNTTEKNIVKSFIKLSKIASKEKYRASLAGAYYKNGELCISNGYWGIMTSKSIEGCNMIDESIMEEDRFDLQKCVHKYEEQDKINISKQDVFNLKKAFELEKTTGNQNKQIVQIKNTFIDFSYLSIALDCMNDNFIMYVSDNDKSPILIQDDFSRAVICPVCVQDKKTSNYNIKKYELK